MRSAHSTEVRGLRALKSLLPSNSSRALRGLTRPRRLLPVGSVDSFAPALSPDGLPVYVARCPGSIPAAGRRKSGLWNVEIFADFLREEVDDLAMARNGR